MSLVSIVDYSFPKRARHDLQYRSGDADNRAFGFHEEPGKRITLRQRARVLDSSFPFGT
jgi:hypothetical protein